MSLPKGLRPRQVVRALQRDGWTVDRQTGSHFVLTKPGHRPITVPNHPALKTGTLRAIIGQAGLTVQSFASLLGKRKS